MHPIDTARDTDHHGLQRQLIDLRIAHADLNAAVDALGASEPVDQLQLQRLKKQRLALKDRIAALNYQLMPKEPA